MNAIKKSLGDYLVDRTESLDEKNIKEFFVDRHDDKIERLLDKEQYLLEGNRGIGKTMLLKLAAIKSDEDFGKSSILTVWVTFEESIRIERIKIIDNQGKDPFLQWTMGKILYETIDKLFKLQPKCINALNTRLSKIFKTKPTTDYKQYSKILNEYISILEKGDIEDNKVLKKTIPSDDLANILDNPARFREFLIGLINNFSLDRIVLLFDEAAHVFSHSQQEKFFTLFKSLRHTKIACNAAVYPGITNYGKYFERGQDAKELRIIWDVANRDDINYIKNILKKRIQSFNQIYWQKLTTNTELIDLICICSNGNPRFSFHIIDELENAGVFKKSKINIQQIIDALRVVFEQKWKEFDTLKKRLVKYKSHIEEAEKLIKNHIIPNLREWNNKKRSINKKLSAGFYLSTQAYDKIREVFDVLAYSNIILIDYNKKSIGSNQYAYYIAINPALLFAESILKSVNEISTVSFNTKEVQGYYDTSIEIKEIVNNVTVTSEYICSNLRCNFKTNSSYKFCPECGSKMKAEEPESLYKILRAHNIDNLFLSKGIKKRLKAKFSTIGEIYDSEIKQIRMKYIKDIRAPKVKNAAIEYMAG